MLKFRCIPAFIAAKYEILNIVDFLKQHLSYLLGDKSYPMEITERATLC